MENDKAILIAVLGAVSVLAIIGLVLMFNSARTVGMAGVYVGDYGSPNMPGIGSEVYFEREWEPSYLERQATAAQGGRDAEQRVGNYG